MKASSKNKKGSRFENFLVEELKKDIDAKAHRTYGSGNGLDKNDINLPNFDIEIEAKNQNRIKLNEWWEQAKRQATDRTTVLAIRNPNFPEFKETLIVMDFEDWKEFLKGKTEKIEVNHITDRTLKYKLGNLKNLLPGLIRELEKYE